MLSLEASAYYILWEHLAVATRHRIDCITRSDRTNPHERITHVGGPNGDGSRWKVAEQEAINGIEQGTWAFYVQIGTNTVDVVVASRLGRKYLKTRNDGEAPDNLLRLQDCPA